MLEWREKFYELAFAAKKYQNSTASDPDTNTNSMSHRIFPEKLRELHQWSELEDNRFLVNQEEWIEFEKSTIILYYTYDEMSDDGIDFNLLSSESTEILYKDIVGKNGKRYRIKLLISGMVAIESK